MMADTTLAADVAATDLLISVAAPLSADDGAFLVQIGTEFLEVERRGAATNPQVIRGAFGTTAASHDLGDDVIIVTPAVVSGVPAAPSAALPFSVDGAGNLIGTLPTADPEVVDALWADAGIVTVSAGPI
jgi:hypothetical protein